MLDKRQYFGILVGAPGGDLSQDFALQRQTTACATPTILGSDPSEIITDTH